MTIQKYSLEKSGFAEVEGGRIHYRYYEPHNSEAAGRAPLIAIHGGPGGSHANMFDAIHELANDRPVVFYDQLGSHFSPAEMTPELMEVSRFRDEVGAVMDALSIEKASLFGHSWGGVIAIEFALAYPEKVEDLILSSPLISTRRWIDDCNDLLDALPEDVQATIRRCEEEGTTDSEEYQAADDIFSARHYCRLDPLPDAIVKHRDKKNETVYGTMWGPSEFTCLGTLREVDLFPRLQEITAPVLLTCGEFDTATPAAMYDAAEELPNARVVVIPDSGHGTFFDGHEAFMKAVSGFLNRNLPESAPSINPGPARP